MQSIISCGKDFHNASLKEGLPRLCTLVSVKSRASPVNGITEGLWQSQGVGRGRQASSKGPVAWTTSVSVPSLVKEALGGFFRECV